MSLISITHMRLVTSAQSAGMFGSCTNIHDDSQRHKASVLTRSQVTYGTKLILTLYPGRLRHQKSIQWHLIHLRYVCKSMIKL